MKSKFYKIVLVMLGIMMLVSLAQASCTISASGPLQFCAGGSVSLSGPAGATSYSWTGPVISTNQSIVATKSGTYILTVIGGSNAGTCQTTVTAWVLPVPNIFASPAYGSCFGTFPVNLTVGPSGLYYLWSTGSINQVHSISAAGTYCVTIANAKGCTASTCKTISTICEIPDHLHNSPTSNGLSTTLSWAGSTCASKYTVEYMDVTTSGPWTTITNIPTANFSIPTITGHIYNWNVSADCGFFSKGTSAYSITASFTALRMEGTNIEASIESFNIYPNPTSDKVMVSFSSDKEQTCYLRMVDVTGRVVISQENPSIIGDNQIELNLSAIPRGLYIMTLQNEDTILQKKVVVQ